MISSHVIPDREAVEANKAQEPEGERLRAELEAWLEKNGIVGIMMDTPEHVVGISYGSRLPERIKPVLTRWGSIYVKDPA